MKIFLLEDDFALNKIIKLSLQNRGFFVDSFSDGYKAVDVILNSKYDLYILDLNVLGFDGHKVLEFIRKDDLNVPIIMISAEIDIENIKDLPDFPEEDFIAVFSPHQDDEILGSSSLLAKAFKDRKSVV